MASPSATGNERTESDAELKERLERQLTLLKEQIAQRREAEDALRRESAIVRLLQAVAAAANQSETVEEAFQFALDRICDHMNWPVGHVFLLSGDENDTIVSGGIWHCADDGRFHAFREATQASRFAPGAGWIGQIFQSGKAAWIMDIFADPGFVRAHHMRSMDVRAGFAFPVLARSEVTAVLEFFSPEPAEPNESLLEAMAYIGTQLGRVVERVRAGEALQRHQRLLANAERLAGLGSWEWDVRRNEVTWSDELYRIYGLSRDEFGGSLEAFLVHVHPDDRDEVAAIVARAREAQTPFRFYHRIIRSDGQVRTLLAHGQLELNETGELKRMFGTGQDVTEQREAETKLARQAEQLTALSEMGQTVTITLDLETVFEKVLGKLMPLLGAAGVFILLLEGDDLVLAAAAGGQARDARGKRVLSTAGVAGEALRTGGAMGLFGREASERALDEIAAMAGYRPGALLVAPLRLRGELIGVIEAIHPEPTGFGDEDLQLLEATASWTAIAIGNARLFEQQQKARQAAEMLRDANARLTQSLDLRKVLQTLLDHLEQLISCDASSVKLIEGSRLVVSAVRGRQHPARSYDLVTLAANHPLKLILDNGRSLLIADTASFDGWDTKLGGPDEVQSWIGVPLLAGGRLIGIYTAGSTRPGYFGDGHLLLAEALAGQSAVAVQNARLFAQVRISQERLRYLTAQVVTAQEAERRRVSRELHDEAGQALTALKISLQLIRTGLPDSQAGIRQQLTEAASLVDETMEHIRLLAHDLRPPVLDAFGLNPSLAGFCQEFARRTSLAIHYEGLDLPSLSDTAQIAFYRFLQETLNNTAKHANPTQVWVRLERASGVARLVVQDDGRGFVVEQEAPPHRGSGVGLIGLQERFELLGGRVTIRSTPGEGTEVMASIPLDEQEEEGTA